jgi:16S rRNA (guanine527-N7)-methyltransferase
MIHVKHRALLGRVADWAGLEIDEQQLGLLERFAGWLETEAIAAGGLGPAERPRIWSRHIADSLAFSQAARPGGRLIDVGTGVGLPAIPLAVVHPDCVITAVDRRRRRIDLLERAVAVLGLQNVVPVVADVDRIEERFDGATFRAVGSLPTSLERAARLLRPGGVGVLGLSRTGRVDTAGLTHQRLRLDVIRIPAGVLDAPLWLLRMERRVDR